MGFLRVGIYSSLSCVVLLLLTTAPSALAQVGDTVSCTGSKWQWLSSTADLGTCTDPNGHVVKWNKHSGSLNIDNDYPRYCDKEVGGEGYYLYSTNTGLVGSLVSIVQHKTYCIQCPSGTYATYSKCYQCPKGFVSDVGYSYDSDFSSAGPCEACEEGVNASPGQDVCLKPCGAGKYSSGASCKKCGVNTYNADAAGIVKQCKPCPGETSSAEGSPKCEHKPAAQAINLVFSASGKGAAVTLVSAGAPHALSAVAAAVFVVAIAAVA